jgi:hypothetical protein
MMRIVFLHGVPLDGTVWRPQLEAFPGALAPDLPGFGSRQLEGEADLGELEPQRGRPPGRALLRGGGRHRSGAPAIWLSAITHPGQSTPARTLKQHRRMVDVRRTSEGRQYRRRSRGLVGMSAVRRYPRPGSRGDVSLPGRPLEWEHADCVPRDGSGSAAQGADHSRSRRHVHARLPELPGHGSRVPRGSPQQSPGRARRGAHGPLRAPRPVQRGPAGVSRPAGLSAWAPVVVRPRDLHSWTRRPTRVWSGGRLPLLPAGREMLVHGLGECAWAALLRLGYSGLHNRLEKRSRRQSCNLRASLPIATPAKRQDSPIVPRSIRSRRHEPGAVPMYFLNARRRASGRARPRKDCLTVGRRQNAHSRAKRAYRA